MIVWVNRVNPADQMMSSDPVNPKKVGGGQFDASCFFPKNVLFRERVKPCFFV